MMTPGFHWKWGLKHPIQSVRIAWDFQYYEVVPYMRPRFRFVQRIFDLPYTWICLTR